jgi:phosphate transport system substrate-binding protein
MPHISSLIALFLLGVPFTTGQNVNALPQYIPQQQLKSPEIMRSWGSPDMAGLMTSWEAGFEKYQPNIRFSDTLKGTETAQAALFTHVADLALMDREILTIERHVMFRREHHLPLEIMVATGSYDVAEKTFALAVLVSQDNPISRLTLSQLDGIFGDERTGAWDDKFIWHPEFARSANENIRTWGQLGATGAWAAKPIHVYGYPVTIYSPISGPMLSFRRYAFNGGDIWNPNLQEYEDGNHIVKALQDDKYGIAYTCLCNKTPSLKSVAIAASPQAPYIELTKGDVVSRKYPLSRSVYIYIDRAPGQPVDPKVKEFLTYVLSREGQLAVDKDGGYLPLTEDLVREQLQKLE